MKYLLLLVLPLLLGNEPEKPAVKESVKQAAENPIDKENCTYKDIPLYGRVKVVRHAADFKVKVVKYGADLRVKKVNAFPDECGKWQFVNSFEDFTVEFVNSGADFTIQYEIGFPGVAY